MNESEAVEILKSALAKNVKTYPISRFMTHPATTTAKGVAHSSLVGAWLGSPGGPTGAGIGAAIGGLVGLPLAVWGGYLKRRLQARNLVARSLRLDKSLMDEEAKAIMDMATKKIKKAAEDKTAGHEAITGRVMKALKGTRTEPRSLLGTLFLGADASMPVEGPIGQWVYARATQGRMARGGAGLTPSERDLIGDIQSRMRKSMVKKVLAGTAIAGGAAYGAKKLVEATSD